MCDSYGIIQCSTLLFDFDCDIWNQESQIVHIQPSHILEKERRVMQKTSEARGHITTKNKKGEQGTKTYIFIVAPYLLNWKTIVASEFMDA